MGKGSDIEWCDHSFNPWWGCMKIGPGCDNCYAASFAHRMGLDIFGAGKPRRYFGEKHWQQPLLWNDEAARSGRRARVFCLSMGDFFDNAADADIRRRTWELIRATPHLDWIIVTKRIGNTASMLPPDWGMGYDNVWLLLTVTDQRELDRDIWKLLAIPAAVRGLSAEPLLEPISFNSHFYDVAGETVTLLSLLDWVIIGGESGARARPMLADWALRLVAECDAEGVALFFKQWGEWMPWRMMTPAQWAALGHNDANRLNMAEWTGGAWEQCRRERRSNGFGGKAKQLVTYGGPAAMARIGRKIAGAEIHGELRRAWPTPNLIRKPTIEGTMP